MGTRTPLGPAGDGRRSRGKLVVAVMRVCAAALVFGLGLYFSSTPAASGYEEMTALVGKTAESL